MRKRIVEPPADPGIVRKGYSRKETCQIVGIGDTLLTDLINKNLLVALRLNKRVIITAESINKLMAGGK